LEAAAWQAGMPAVQSHPPFQNKSLLNIYQIKQFVYTYREFAKDGPS